MKFEQYVEQCIDVIKKHTDKLGVLEMEEAWKSIENAPAFCGRVWIEDILDQAYNNKMK